MNRIYSHMAIAGLFAVGSVTLAMTVIAASTLYRDVGALRTRGRSGPAIAGAVALNFVYLCVGVFITGGIGVALWRLLGL